jgi:hypothetical protein
VIVLDMDCTTDVVHGEQQLRLFNAYENEYCFQPFHLYEGLSGKRITAVLRPGKRPTAGEVMSVLKRIVKRLKEAWPKTKFLFRGDSHFAKPEVLNWLEGEGLFYVVGLARNSVLLKGMGLACEEFDTIRLRFVKIGTRVPASGSRWQIRAPSARYHSQT